MYNRRLKAPGRLDKVHGRHRGPRASVGARPGQHRHVPALGRKNQDSTELTGRHQPPQDRRVRQRKRSAGVQLRRREFNIANRGPDRFIEVLKLDVAFLASLLGARGNTRSNPRSFHRPTSTQSSSGTPTSEYRKLQSNSSWKPCATAPSRIDVYVTNLKRRNQYLRKDYNSRVCASSTSLRIRSKRRPCGPC